MKQSAAERHTLNLTLKKVSPFLFLLLHIHGQNTQIRAMSRVQECIFIVPVHCKIEERPAVVYGPPLRACSVLPLKAFVKGSYLATDLE